jgi:hypothetical protein
VSGIIICNIFHALTKFNHSQSQTDKTIARIANVSTSTLGTWKARGQRLACLVGGGKFSHFD